MRCGGSRRIQEDKLETLERYMRGQLEEGKIIHLPFRLSTTKILFWQDGQVNTLLCSNKQDADEYMAELLG